MQLKLDVKTLIIGLTLGIAITVAIGAGTSRAGTARFGIALETKGSALVKTQDGSLYIVNPQNAMAIRVLQANRASVEFADRREPKSKPFNLSSSGLSKSASKKY